MRQQANDAADEIIKLNDEAASAEILKRIEPLTDDVEVKKALLRVVELTLG